MKRQSGRVIKFLAAPQDTEPVKLFHLLSCSTSTPLASTVRCSISVLENSSTSVVFAKSNTSEGAKMSARGCCTLCQGVLLPLPGSAAPSARGCCSLCQGVLLPLPGGAAPSARGCCSLYQGGAAPFTGGVLQSIIP